MKILIFDNYDSFTYNLVHLVEAITHSKADVYRNDEISLDKIEEYDKIILSPGPGIPSEAGLLLSLIKKYAATKSILGVCLGHQAIAEAFGAKLINLSSVFHGIATACNISTEAPVFRELPEHIQVGRYHSWVISEENFPDELKIIARDENDYIMALQHKGLDVTGFQFHPESVLTPDGKKILENWLNR